MNRRRSTTFLAARMAFAFIVMTFVPSPVTAEPLAFRVTLDPAFQQTPYTGRVYVVISNNKQLEPRLDINNWFHPPRILARDAVKVPPGQAIILGGGPLAFPDPLPDLPAGEYFIQAIARRSLDHPVPGRGAGDLYSEARLESLDPKRSGPVVLRLGRVVEPRGFVETDRVKLVEVVSTALSRFHGREVKIRAGVLLPQGWKDDPSVRYPVLYVIPGFGGSHHMVRFIAQSQRPGGPGGDILTVVPDPTCYLGHSVFADSENNGPWGWALLHELIPAVENRFHGAESGEHRYVMGVSSGGWSALWLQVTYPDSFNGCWSHTPDPVDFRDFQRINLYEPGANMYVDKTGARRPLARQGDQVLLWYKDFVRQETVLGPGGQIHSFEAVFSHRSDTGRPELLFDRVSGKVNADVARTWERYDLRLILERNWKALAPKLAGKLHVFAGGRDNFYLEGAVRRLKETLRALGSDAEVKIIPEMGHGLYREALAPMYRTILNQFRKEFSPTTKAAGSPTDSPHPSNSAKVSKP